MIRRRSVSIRSGLLLAAACCCIACSGEAPAPETSSPAAGTAAAAGTAEEGRSAAAPPVVVDPGRLHLGLDLSGHSGSVDWRAIVEAGHSFAFIKATEGVDLEDPDFDLHWPAMKEAGIVRGAYHFFVTEDDPEAQARFFIEHVTLEPGDLAPVVDVELIGHNSPPGLPGRLKKWLALVEAHYGVKPIIYTTAEFWDEHFTDEFGDHPLWVAEYDVEEPRLPAGWKQWHLWQWKDDAPVPGVEKGADLSRVNRSGVDLSTLLIPATTLTEVGETAASGES